MRCAWLYVFRKLLTRILCGLSLLLCLVAGSLWPRSYWIADQFNWSNVQKQYSLNFVEGGIELFVEDNIYCEINPLSYKKINLTISPALPLPGMNGRWGFSYGHFGGGKYQVPVTEIYRMSIVVPLLVFCLFPLLYGLCKFRRSRIDEFARKCGACGYDIRASPTRCPECGTNVMEMPSVDDIGAHEPPSGEQYNKC